MKLKGFNDYVIKDDYAILKINSNKYGLKECIINIDTLNYLLKLPYSWHLSPIGKNNNINRSFYAVCHARRRYNKSQKLYLHDLVMNHNPDIKSGYVIDHINRNGLDNRKSNLRLITQSINLLNSNLPINNTSGSKGVSYIKRLNKYRARVVYRNKEIHLGLFKTIEEASLAVENYKRDIINNAVKT